MVERRKGHSPDAAHPRGSLASQTRASSPRTGSAAHKHSHVELQHLRADMVGSARAIQDEIDQMTQGSVSYRTVEVAGLPSARTADGALDARVSIQVRTRGPQLRSPRGRPGQGNPDASTALPRLKLADESTRRHHLSSPARGLVAAEEGSARRRKDFAEVPQYQQLQQQSMTLVSMVRAGASHARGARMAGLSNPFKAVGRKKTSDLTPFPSAKPSLHEAANRRSRRRGEAGRNASGSPLADTLGTPLDGSPRAGLAATLQGARWSKGTSAVDRSTTDEERQRMNGLKPGGGFFVSGNPQQVLSQTNQNFGRKLSKQQHLSPARPGLTSGPSAGGIHEPSLLAPGLRTQGDLHGARPFLRPTNPKALQVQHSLPQRQAGAMGGGKPLGCWDPQVTIGVGSATELTGGVLDTPALPRPVSTTLGYQEPTSPAAINILRQISSDKHPLSHFNDLNCSMDSH